MDVRRNLRNLATFGVALAVVSSCSALRDSTATVPYQVIVSEVHFHDALDRDDKDFLEILNTGEKKVAVTGWCVRGVDFCFDEETVLQPNEYLTVSGNQFKGTLSNLGESLELVDSQDNVRDTVAYATSAEWPAHTDGDGYSLHRLTRGEPAKTAQHWRGAEPSPGAPAPERGSPAPRKRTVVINEINYHPIDDDPSMEFIELLNTSATAVDISGWCLAGLEFCVTAASIPAGGTHLLTPNPGVSILSNGGPTVRLVDTTGELVDIAPVGDSGEWPARTDGGGHSLQRRDPLLTGVEPGNWLSAEPSPGTPNTVTAPGFMPSFRNVTHTDSPEPTESTVVTADALDTDNASLVYRIGFGDETTVAMTKTAAGSWTATIPPQTAGSLVRYRLIGTSAAGEGLWPREGDGARYSGTVVKDTPANGLPELKWFIDDATYSKAYTDKREYGDSGYSSVFAYNGQIMDNALIRVKGQQSRSNYKRKWKVALPIGHQWDMSGLLRNNVNEFSLHSAVTDKSFVREILTSDLQDLSGGMAQQVFPLRLTKNGEFFGLYLYVEQPDGIWRNKYGFSSDTLVFKGERTATLRPDHLNLPEREFALRYQQKTHRYRDAHDTLRGLIRAMTDSDEKKVLEFAHQHLDIPQIIEAIATMKVAQHLEWEHKNYQVFYDPADEKWRLIPVDFDLNFGRRYQSACKSLCDDVAASNYPEYFSANRLGRIFFKNPQLRAMLDRRTRTLADAFYADGLVEKRIEELAQLLEADAAADRKIWYTYGEQQTMRQGQQILIKNFLVPKRRIFLGEGSSQLPPAQKESVSFTVSGSETVIVTNTDSVAIDLSGTKVQGIDGEIPSGTVLAPNQSAVLSNTRTKAPSFDGRLHVWVPPQWPRATAR